MSRLQNAKTQLNEALLALESAASQVINVSKAADAVPNPSQMGTQPVAGTDLSALIDEVSLIDAQLSQAITMIASVKSGEVGPSKKNDGDTQ